jgi:putative DNA primase/helicase
MDKQFEQNTRPSDDTELERLSRLSPFEYDRQRKGAAERLGVSVTTIDEEVKKRRKIDNQRGPGAGREMRFPEVEPWPEPVDGAELLTELSSTIGQFVVMQQSAIDAVSLWAVMTWLHDRLRIAPFLNITSATKRCGKTTLIDVLTRLSHKPMPVSGQVSGAVLFRIIDLYEPTLFLDEMDTYFRDDEALRGIINGSQRKRNANVPRCVGDDHTPRLFSTWCPKALVGIGGLTDTVTDRSIVVRLERRAAGQAITNFRDRDRGQFDALRRKIRRWIDDSARTVVERLSSAPFPNGLDDRARDSWECLLTIAALADGEWPARAAKACLTLNGERQGVESFREQILSDVQEIFEDAGQPRALATDYILANLNSRDGSPWLEWKGRPLTARGLATLLKPFGIVSGSVRIDGFTPKGYKLESFEKAFSLYLGGKLSATTPQPVETLDFSQKLSATTEVRVADMNSLKPAEIKACGVVADTLP